MVRARSFDYMVNISRVGRSHLARWLSSHRAMRGETRERSLNPKGKLVSLAGYNLSSGLDWAYDQTGSDRRGLSGTKTTQKKTEKLSQKTQLKTQTQKTQKYTAGDSKKHKRTQQETQKTQNTQQETQKNTRKHSRRLKQTHKYTAGDSKKQKKTQQETQTKHNKNTAGDLSFLSFLSLF